MAEEPTTESIPETTGDPRAGDGGDWYRLDVDDVLSRLDVDRDGLDDAEVRRRRERHGPNRIREQTTVSAWRVLLDQFTSPLVYVLVGALAITLSIGNHADAIVVGAVLVLNASIGFTQEYRAQTAVQSLMEMVSPTATVRRSGEQRRIDAVDVVPGDVVRLVQGEVVPADVRLVETNGLRIDESALTGESVPANKDTDPIHEDDLPPADQRDMAFMGTAVTAGDGDGVVVATGSATEIGRISEQVEEASVTETPLERRIDDLARWITVGILAIAAVTFGIGLAIGRSVTEMLLLAVALSVSAIPAGLPVVVTVALAIGVNRMARREALIRRLPAVDTLGSTTMIVSDKTGTLTRNRMTVRSVLADGERFEVDEDGRLLDVDGDHVDLDGRPALREALRVGLLCNEVDLGSGERAGPGGDDSAAPDTDDGDPPAGDPMEVALLQLAVDVGLDPTDLRERYRRRDAVPFRTEQRFMATVHEVPDGEDGPLVAVKGAPERIVGMCDRSLGPDGGHGPLDADETVAGADELAAAGLRVLALAVGRGDAAAREVHGDDPGGLTFVGMQALLDPPRSTAVEAVDRCHDAGIRVIMVTGDHATTAAAVGAQVHIGGPGRRGSDPSHEARGDDADREEMAVRTGQEIAGMSDEELDETLGEVDVYSRVAPDQKLRIVERLKSSGEVVAVTGDGVNDAPALESAHLGAAMGSGTDVAKEASDMVITDDDFASVYAAVEEGRTSFRNIRMATFFLLSTGAAEVLIFLFALGLDWPLPLVPAQVLWLNVVTNGIADVALAFEPGEKALYRRRPRPRSEGILDRWLLERLVLVGAWLAAGSLLIFWWHWGLRDEELVAARTATLTTLVLFQKVHVFNCRSEDVSVFSKNLLANKVLLAGVTVSLGIHIGAMYLPVTQRLLDIEPMGALGWAVSIGAASTVVAVNEAHKRLRPRSGIQSSDTGLEPATD